ncbi:nucleotidyltransferase, partial [Rossellomorea marisflavi]
EEVPPILISPEFIVNLNSDTQEAVERVHGFLSNVNDDTLKSRYIKGYLKKLIRALYSLILEDTGVWQDDIAKMKSTLADYGTIDSALVDDLYASYLDSHVDVEEFLGIADEVYRYIEKALTSLAASRSTPS